MLIQKQAQSKFLRIRLGPKVMYELRLWCVWDGGARRERGEESKEEGS